MLALPIPVQPRSVCRPAAPLPGEHLASGFVATETQHGGHSLQDESILTNTCELSQLDRLGASQEDRQKSVCSASQARRGSFSCSFGSGSVTEDSGEVGADNSRS